MSPTEIIGNLQKMAKLGFLTAADHPVASEVTRRLVGETDAASAEVHPAEVFICYK